MDNTINLLNRKKTIKCPTCGKEAKNNSLPFCSPHCSHVDLCKWFNGTYSVPTFEDPDGSEIIRLNDEE